MRIRKKLIGSVGYSLLLIGAAGSLQQAQAGVPTSGLVGHWTGNGSANDSSSIGNNGTFAGSYVLGTNSQEAFDLATGGVVIPNNSAYAFTSGLSVGFWFNFNGNSPAPWDIIGQDVGPGSNPKWFIDYDYEHPGAFELLFSPPFVPPFNAITVATAPVSPTGWNQLTLTWDGSAFDFYLNAELIGSGAYSGVFPNPSAPLQFSFDDGGSAFPGLMQDVVLYNRALTLAEVQELANKPVPEPASAGLFGVGLIGLVLFRRRRR